MDVLLSLAFDNISSSDLSKIRKGLRQIEGILAQICLSSPAMQSPSKRRASLLQPPTATPVPKSKTLADLPSDPAFLTFFHLQDTFSHNLCSRLITTLERLLGHPTSTTTTTLLHATLTLLHGTLLLHPPSRTLFSTESAMNLLLDLLDVRSAPSIQSAALAVLSAALLASPANARAFDSATDGIATVASLYKAPSTDAFVRANIEDLLAAYMMPEAAQRQHATPASSLRAAPRSEPGSKVGGAARADLLAVGRRPSTVGDGPVGESSLWDGDASAASVTRSGGEKKRLLGRYMGNVDEVLEAARVVGLVDSAG